MMKHRSYIVQDKTSSQGPTFEEQVEVQPCN